MSFESPTSCAKAIAELYASFPRLRIVFCSNRKTANEWTRRFFDAVWANAGAAAESAIELGPDLQARLPGEPRT